MKYIAKYLFQHKAVGLLFVGLALVLISSFKPEQETKEVITIDLWELASSKRDVGIYVYQNGKRIEFVQLPVESTSEGIINRGEVFNKTLTKYYSQGWRLITACSGTTGGHSYRYVLEK